MRATALLCLMLLLPAAAHAVDPPVPQGAAPPGLLPLLARPEHRTALLQAAQTVDQASAVPCPSANYTTTGEIGLLAPLRLDAKGQAVAGAWKESINQAGCGGTRLLNAITMVQSDGSLVTRPLLPGTTITDPQLQQDSIQYAAAGLGEMPAGCERGAVVDTLFLGVTGEPTGTRPTPGGPPKPWDERWTLQACTKKAMVNMHFAPDATGTEIRSTPVP